MENRESMNIVIVGHVDHGKSTIIGRLMADTNSLPEGKLEQVKEKCRRNDKPFEYAFLLDALKDEQEQGITIDSARCFFKTLKRDYIIIDAPGHIEFLKNMITGASRAEVAFLVIDANEGIKENSTRHAYLLSMLGIKQIVVLVNKMDMVNYDQKVYENVVIEYKKFLEQIQVYPIEFIPVSGREGDNIVSASSNMKWYRGYTVLEQLDAFTAVKEPNEQPFRMPVQGVYKFTGSNDTRRIVAGTIETGSISIGDDVVFYPSGKKSRVKSIETFNVVPKKEATAGYAVGFTLEEQIYITRGEIATKDGEKPPIVGGAIKVNLFWLGKKPLSCDKKYLLKLGTAKINMYVKKIVKVMNASNLECNRKEIVEKYEVAEVILELDKILAFDLNQDLACTSRFVIVDEYEIAGGGIIKQVIEDKKMLLNENVIRRNYKWQKGKITCEQREERYSQHSGVICITGLKEAPKKEIAKELEKKLFNEGRMVYFMGISNVLYGVDADIKGKQGANVQEEHIRRLAEVTNVMIDAGLIVIITATNLNKEDIYLMKQIIGEEKLYTIWVGDKIPNIDIQLYLETKLSVQEQVEKIKEMMQDNKIIFKL